MATLTEHAKLKMRERGIKLSDAILVMEKPSIVFYDTITGCNIALAAWRGSPTKQLLVSYILADSEVKKDNNVVRIINGRGVNCQEGEIRKMPKDKAKLRYDKEADIVYIKIKDGSIKNTVDVAEDVFVEHDKDGNIAGIEIWRARQLLLNPLAKHIAEQVKLASKTS